MRVQTMNDKELVSLYIKGEEKPLEVLIERHKAKIFSTIIYFVKDEALAQDIFQDAFIKVIDTLRSGKYKEEGKFLPWVMRICYNLCIDHFRKQKRTPMVTNSEGFDIFNVLKFADTNAEEQMVLDQTTKKVRTLINRLPDEQREVVILRHYAEMSFKEIAEMTGVSINTALGRMRYALINMRKMLSRAYVSI